MWHFLVPWDIFLTSFPLRTGAHLLTNPGAPPLTGNTTECSSFCLRWHVYSRQQWLWVEGDLFSFLPLPVGGRRCCAWGREVTVSGGRGLEKTAQTGGTAGSRSSTCYWESHSPLGFLVILSIPVLRQEDGLIHSCVEGLRGCSGVRLWEHLRGPCVPVPRWPLGRPRQHAGYWTSPRATFRVPVPTAALTGCRFGLVSLPVRASVSSSATWAVASACRVDFMCLWELSAVVRANYLLPRPPSRNIVGGLDCRQPLSLVIPHGLSF